MLRVRNVLVQCSMLTVLLVQFVVLALTVCSAYAYGGYGASAGLGLSLGGFNGGLVKGGLIDGGLVNGGLGLGLLNKGCAYGGCGRALPIGPIDAAIQSTRSYEVIPVALPQELPVPQTIDVGPNVQPVDIIFRTQSSPMNVQQIHTPSAGVFESTRSEDEASVLTHESYRPVIQNYREVIQPFRNIEQRVEPVIEHVHTAVAQGTGYRQAPLALAGPVAPLGLAGPALLAKGGHY